jgi:tRNA nucleotidyltransferase (CCA-adding enzyme)
MKCYLVGGAVRDLLLGLPVTERDWLVTDTTPEELLTQGFRQVGKDFPVFLHPKTHEEYALPRRSRGDTASGPVSLEQDLARRDLTINALAQGPDGEIIDPCGGQADLEQRILRHTPAFTEDPIRVLRLARFAARYHPLGFQIAPETQVLVQEMAGSGQLDELVPERAWAEIARALSAAEAPVFFQTLRELGALAPILPELDRLFGVPQPPRHHPEIDTGLHTLLVLEQACRLSSDPQVRFAALVHDLGKGATPKEILPRHIGHEKRGAALIRGLCQRLRIPNAWRDLALLVARHHGKCHCAFELRSSTLLKLLVEMDALRKPQRLEQFLLACEADVRGRTGLEWRPYPQAGYLRAVFKAARGIDTQGICRNESDSSRIPLQLARARLRAITEVRREWADRENGA